MRTLATLAALVLWPLAAAAAEEADVIFPDRAGAATSAGTAPPGEVQLEVGAQYARERTAGTPAERRLGVEANLTVGLTERLEIAVDGEPLVRLRGPADETDGGDVALSLKYRLFDPPEDRWWPTVAVQPFIKLPVAQPPVGSGATATGLTHEIGRGVSLFTDLFYGTRDEREGRHQLGLDAGVMWVGTPDLAFDASAVTALAGAGPDWAIRAGVSVRFGR